MNTLLPCPTCAAPRLPGDQPCPGCGMPQHGLTQIRPAALLLVGLTTGCDGILPETQAEYGAPVWDTGDLDQDGDGYTIRDGDCNDSDDTVHPDADETVGDGIDSNCDGEDDT